MSQMLLIDALQHALAVRIDTTAPAETILRAVTQYTYNRPE